MTWNIQTWFTYAFCFVFFNFLAVHYAHMKSPGQTREIASHVKIAEPWYNASYKY